MRCVHGELAYTSKLLHFLQLHKATPTLAVKKKNLGGEHVYLIWLHNFQNSQTKLNNFLVSSEKSTFKLQQEAKKCWGLAGSEAALAPHHKMTCFTDCGVRPSCSGHNHIHIGMVLLQS